MSWKNAKKILCVRLDTLGDVLMTTPALRALKESGSHPALTLLTSTVGQHVARLVPEIDRIIVYDSPWMKATEPRLNADADFALIRQLKAEKFDAAVIFTVFSQNPVPAALLCYLAEIPLRLGYCRENPYQLLTDWVPESEPQRQIRHEVRRQLDLVGSVGAVTRDERLSLCVPEGAEKRVLQVLTRAGLDVDRPWVAMHPGASAPSRRYPPTRFAEVGTLLKSQLDCQVVLTGGDSEKDLVDEVRRNIPGKSSSVAGMLDLGELAALLRLAPVLISNNSGPVHVAAAVGTPVVDLYALTNPQHKPWGVENRVLSHDVPCKNCFKSVCPEQHHNCLSLIAPQAVVDAAQELLEERLREMGVFSAVG
ncbi:MAG: lipopolysaccharide heptosyltransferase II [Acidobacteria bacterium]|nr:MAG: lipopolysaccharide heptosyltransferase II [Acidobacteriota bacterium]